MRCGARRTRRTYDVAWGIRRAHAATHVRVERDGERLDEKPTVERLGVEVNGPAIVVLEVDAHFRVLCAGSGELQFRLIWWTGAPVGTSVKVKRALRIGAMADVLRQNMEALCAPLPSFIKN
jgi:hypothetical protein